MNSISLDMTTAEIRTENRKQLAKVIIRCANHTVILDFVSPDSFAEFLSICYELENALYDDDMRDNELN